MSGVATAGVVWAGAAAFGQGGGGFGEAAGALGTGGGGADCGCLLGEKAWFSHSGCRLGTAAGVCQREWANGQLVRGHVPASNQK